MSTIGLTQYAADGSYQVWDAVADTYTSYDASGNVVSTRALSPAESAQVAPILSQVTAAANLKTLNTAAKGALTANATFLSITAPTSAQFAAQVEALTKQNDALIRLVAKQLSGTN